MSWQAHLSENLKTLAFNEEDVMTVVKGIYDIEQGCRQPLRG